VKVEPPKQEFEIRKKNKKTSVPINVDTQSHAMPTQARQKFAADETAWFNQDSGILELKAIKNELESFTYDLKNNIDSYGPYEKYVDPAVREQILPQLQQTVDWIYGDGQAAPAQAFRAKLDEYKKFGIPIKQRFLFHTEFPIYLEQFQNFSSEMSAKLAESATLTDQVRGDILSKFTEIESYFNVLKQILASKQPHEDVGVSIDEVQIKLETFKQTVTQLFNTPPPKPSTEAPKAPEQKPAE
jgi:hypothetical protein